MEQIPVNVEGTIQFIDAAWKNPPNKITPFVRKLDWGVPGGGVAVNRFSLKEDEALVITLDAVGAKYLGFQVTDPWLRSVDYWNHTSSLSNQQAKPNADGTFTYVLSPKDPGFYNWLDTGGLHEGSVVIRWENLPTPGDIDRTVRDVRVVKLSALSTVLPKSAPRVTAAERQQLLAARNTAFEKRIARD